jgi:DNA-directed RNA polymerase sigma subunit (sigma70/sigma32)
MTQRVRKNQHDLEDPRYESYAMTYEQIAREIGSTETAVRQTLSRAIAKLRHNERAARLYREYCR